MKIGNGSTSSRYVRWLEDVGLEDASSVGGKSAALGEMIQALSPEGILVPGGFAITADAYTELLKSGGIEKALRDALSGLDKDDVEDLLRRGQACRALIRQAGLPHPVKRDILSAYKDLQKCYGTGVDVAVRSSATAEDLPEASFAGQQETFLNVRGELALLDACLNCFASLFTDRAIAYRIDHSFDHMSVKLSICVQKMVRSDLAASGVIFTLDPESGFRDVVLITSAYGLGENVVQGRIDPDEFVIYKPTLKLGYKPILKRKVGTKQVRMIYAGRAIKTTTNNEVLAPDRERLSLTDDEVLTLARWSCMIEDHFSRRAGRSLPMDIEWAQDGLDGQLYIVQARPETVHALKDKHVLETYRLEEEGKLLLQGTAVGERIGAGKARLIKSVRELATLESGEVLVTEMTDPDWEPVMKRASAIVTNKGGRTCHAAIVSREIGIPCVVGTGQATKLLRTGQEITVSCANGEVGCVYEGKLTFKKESLRLDKIPATRTRLMLNLGNPERALALSHQPVDGVGLARIEFIIADRVKVHPLALTRFDKLNDELTKLAIEKLTYGYNNREDYFVEKLAEGIGMIAAAFYPREVIVRLSDFKSNEYANLIGGEEFEISEENPMIGFRGACRYCHQDYRDGFALECRAILSVREDMGLTNVKVMVPFCRTPEEGQNVIEEMRRNGLVQAESGLETYVMCELPSNVLLADEFAAVFDGFSIGSNDLTQLVLGLDRDNAMIASLFDERSDAVKRAIAEAIASAHRARRPIGICGQAPSDYPEFVRFLIEQGIDSISLNEDAVIKTLLRVAEIERQLKVTA